MPSFRRMYVASKKLVSMRVQDIDRLIDERQTNREGGEKEEVTDRDRGRSREEEEEGEDEDEEEE